MMKNEFKTRVLLSAYTQLNLGDDLLIKSIIERYPNTLFVIPCRKRYKGFLSLYKNVVQINLYTRFALYFDNLVRRLEPSSFYALNSVLLKYLDIKYHFTHYIIIGGSIFMENPSVDKGFNTYKSYLRVKKLLKNAYIDFIGCSFGPYKTEQYVQNISKVLSIADDVCFRDKMSYASFPIGGNIRLGNDVVLENLKVPAVSKRKKIGISLISLRKRNNLASLAVSYRNKIVEVITYFVKEGYDVVLFSFCEHLGDMEEVNAIMESLPEKQRVCAFNYNGNIDEALKCFGQMEYVIATRFHAVILGVLFKSKILPIAYSCKTKEMLSDYGLWKDDYDISNFVDLDIHKIVNSFILSYSIENRDRQFKKLDCQLS